MNFTPYRPKKIIKNSDLSSHHLQETSIITPEAFSFSIKSPVGHCPFNHYYNFQPITKETIPNVKSDFIEEHFHGKQKKDVFNKNLSSMENFKTCRERQESSKDVLYIKTTEDDLGKFSLCSSVNKSKEREISEKLPILVPNSRFFKVKPRITSLHYEKTKKTHKPKGKSIQLHELKELSGKEAFLSKLEQTRSLISPSSSPLSSTSFKVYFKEYLSKKGLNLLPFKKERTIESKQKKLSLSEEDLIDLMEKFFNKLSKSQNLMKYFKDKNSNQILCKMAKSFHDLISIPVENHRSSFEIIENLHRPLKISQADYEIFTGLFIMTMRENKIKEPDIQILSKTFQKLRVFIIKTSDFEDICPHMAEDDFFTNLHKSIRENGVLDRIFDKLDEGSTITHHRKMFSLICKGFDNSKKEITRRDTHNRLGVTWRDCFELKNSILNEILDMKKVTFSVESNDFFENLHNLHKFILPDPNPYSPIFETFNFQWILDLLMNFIQKEPILNNVFFGWTHEKLLNHCKYILNFIQKSPQNAYILSDLAPAHCKTYITDKEFNYMFDIINRVLSQVKVKNEDASYILMNFQKSRGMVSREKSLLEKLGGAETIDAFIEMIYVLLFGSAETKQFFVNTNVEYVKFKEKLFFARLLNDEIDGVDLVDLRAIHEKLGIKQKHFDAFLDFSKETLINLKIKPVIVNKVLERIDFLRGCICFD